MTSRARFISVSRLFAWAKSRGIIKTGKENAARLVAIAESFEWIKYGNGGYVMRTIRKLHRDRRLEFNESMPSN